MLTRIQDGNWSIVVPWDERGVYCATWTLACCSISGDEYILGESSRHEHKSTNTMLCVLLIWLGKLAGKVGMIAKPRAGYNFSLEKEFM